MANDNKEKEQSRLSLEGIVSQLEDLVKLTMECEKKELRPGVSFVDITEQLDNIKNAVGMLHQAYLNTLEALSITEQDVAKMREKAIQVSERDKKLFEKLDKLQKQCEEGCERMYSSLQQHRTQAREVEEQLKGERQKKKGRKAKFKGVGGRKGWMPT